MTQRIEVSIVKAGKHDDLAALVNEKIKEGWRPSGSPYFCPYDDQRQHCWAIEREMEEKGLTPEQRRDMTCPYEEIRDLYHELCPGLIRCRLWTKLKKARVRELWQIAGGFRTKDKTKAWKFLTVFFQEAQEDPFLRGEVPNPRFPNFKGGYLDMICRDEWISKIMEG